MVTTVSSVQIVECELPAERLTEMSERLTEIKMVQRLATMVSVPTRVRPCTTSWHRMAGADRGADRDEGVGYINAACTAYPVLPPYPRDQCTTFRLNTAPHHHLIHTAGIRAGIRAAI